MVKISILIPVYNVEDYIIRCLNSVVEQMLLNLRLEIES